MKEIYEMPELKVSKFSSVDVMTASDAGDDNFVDFGKSAAENYFKD